MSCWSPSSTIYGCLSVPNTIPHHHKFLPTEIHHTTHWISHTTTPLPDPTPTYSCFFLKPYLWTLSFHIFAPYPICVCKYIIAGIAYILFDRFAKTFNKLPGKDVKPLTVGIRPQKSVQKFMHIPVMDMQYFPPPHPIFSKA